CRGPDGGRECATSCFSSEGKEATLRWGLRSVYFRRILAGAHRVIAYSEHVATYFEQYAPAGQGIRVIPNGISFPAAAIRRPSERRPPGAPMRLAFCGAVVRHKGVHTIMEALRVAQVAPVRLLVLGATPDVGYMA